ncbi:Protein CBG16404 [Caenorhabditis briggsae]|uniref:RING-type domain-containing protein n=2 Tax=Caenorhabditis briggsae TaxID=6238 RepID=A0AAE9JNA6_CAEBR|nr:Protein CBG16404 [Caenorhabditis briggsae]ULT79655.1 hypothetical protein L3Y34_010320 [Caenorhabditis briggsae]UMM38962.1 hypothetical protein L5515_016210 [Caenorhabditis briggsae]CAP34075.2 Protein CBG16404 [Caenorhabditis briggsae]
MLSNVDFSRCPTCLEDYDDNSHRPCVGFCGHSICLKCQTKLVNCPLCKRKNSFFGTVINYQLLDSCLAIRQLLNESPKSPTAGAKSPNRIRAPSQKRMTETPNISQQVVNATRRSRRTALETTVDKTQQREIENNWISQHIPAPESRRRDRSLRRLSERMVGPDNIPAVCYRTIYTIPPPENFAAQGIPSAFNRMFFGRSCFEI